MKLLLLFTTLHALVALVICNDITNAVFSKEVNRMPAAFGDFNSDELTDMFVLSEDGKSVQIMFAFPEEPLFRLKPGFDCSFFGETITSVVPGDFDGDVFMDILITTLSKTDTSAFTNVYILWGEGDKKLNCSNDSKPKLKMIGQPLAIDYDQNFIIDLFGTDINGVRTFWIFNTNRTEPEVIPMIKPDSPDFGIALPPIREPHSNAFLDLNDDSFPDLVITTDQGIEYWYGREKGFYYGKTVPLPVTSGSKVMIGQSLHLDVELEGKMDMVVPVCSDYPTCKESTIMVYSDEKWNDLLVDFKNQSKNLWGFATDGQRYTNIITLRGGDFNMDGYPDLLATLKSIDTSETRSFLLENVPCETCGKFNRTFKVRWNNPFFGTESVMATFYDFYQDGILDVILVYKDSVDKTLHKTAAFKNSLDYDANFVKVMILTGLENDKYPPISPGSITKKKRTYGTNLPGPSIAYKTITQDGNRRNAKAAQIPQSAHFSLNLPFTIFGLGRTPNFIDLLTVGLGGKTRDWTQIIPNSQMVVIPTPVTEPLRWKAQLFVTPSKLILLSAAALTATCGLITLIIVALYWKERREDKIEKLQEAHRFHFDAM